MPVETAAQTLVVPAFGAAFPYQTEVTLDFVNYRGEFRALAKGTLPLGEFIALDQLGLAAERGDDVSRYPAGAVSAGRALYALNRRMTGRGNVPATGVIFGQRPPRGIVVPKGYAVALCRTHPELTIRDGATRVDPTPLSRDEIALLPPEGFAVPTDAGELYDRFSGFAIATMPDKGKAIRRYMQVFDCSEEVAAREVSYLFVPSNPSGERAVERSSVGWGGPLWVVVDSDADSADPNVGSLPARRLRAERAEPALTAADVEQLRGAAEILKRLAAHA